MEVAVVGPRRVDPVRAGGAGSGARGDRQRARDVGGGGGRRRGRGRPAREAERGCTFFTVLGDDELGRRSHEQLTGQGVRVEAEFVSRPTAPRHVRRRGGERTITVLGEKPTRARATTCRGSSSRATTASTSPRATSARSRPPAAPACSSRPPRARRCCARRRSSSTRSSGAAKTWASSTSRVDPPPRSSSRPRAGSAAGRSRAGRFRAAPLPGPVSDTYGAGDSFAAGLTFGLAKGLDSGKEALELASRCGAAVLTGRGPYEGQLTD